MQAEISGELSIGMINDKNETDLLSLLVRFNARDKDAFVSIYKLLFMELHLYASRLYANTTVSPEDAVQDIFCYLLEKREANFDTLTKLKAFLYTAIKNRYRTYLDHLKVQEKYKTQNTREEDFSAEIVENELYIALTKSIELLPENYARVMRLYLAGREIDEIAQTLNLSPQTVYNTKHLAIRFLKEKLSRLHF